MRPIKSVCKYIQNGKDDDGDDEIRGSDRYLHIRVQMIMMTVMMMMVMMVMMMMMVVVMMMLVIMIMDPEAQVNTHTSVFIETLSSTVGRQRYPKAKTIQTSHSQIEE